MASVSDTSTTPKINGTGKSHTLNPEARIFVPRQNFAVNNNTQKQAASTTGAAATTAAAATTITTARAATTTAPPPPAPTTAAPPPPPITTAPPPPPPPAAPPLPPPHYFQYRPSPVVPVVYPSVYGTPGTIFFMPMYQVPPSAVLLPLENGNGAEMAFHYRIASKNIKKQKEPSQDSSTI